MQSDCVCVCVCVYIYVSFFRFFSIKAIARNMFGMIYLFLYLRLCWGSIAARGLQLCRAGVPLQLWRVGFSMNGFLLWSSASGALGLQQLPLAGVLDPWPEG